MKCISRRQYSACAGRVCLRQPANAVTLSGVEVSTAVALCAELLQHDALRSLRDAPPRRRGRVWGLRRLRGAWALRFLLLMTKCCESRNGRVFY